MICLRLLVLVGLVLTVPIAAAGDKDKVTDNTWAKIISGSLTPEQSKKGLKLQENAIVKPDTVLTYPAKDLGAKLSLKTIQEKYGKPSKAVEYRVKEGEKILSRMEYHYPPIYFVADKDSDDVFLIAAPKRLWAGAGILENAREALKK
jgi:hypothetical protein